MKGVEMSKKEELKRILEEYKHAPIKITSLSEVTYPIDDAIQAIIKLFIESLPEKREEGVFVNGGCNPDWDRGFNECLNTFLQGSVVLNIDQDKLRNIIMSSWSGMHDSSYCSNLAEIIANKLGEILK